MINYSVIIPHHNTPDLLDRCLKSIPERDDLEVIIVDDNSSEDIVDFDKFPGQGLEKVHILFTKEGRGAGYARNCGVRVAQGRWLVFADSDDYFTSSINAVFEKYADDDIHDLVFLNANKFNERGEIWGMSQNTYIANYLTGKKWSEEVLRYGFWSPWSRMFKRNIVVDNNVLFEELPIGNDMMFVLNATKKSAVICVEQDIVYMYFCPTYGSQTSHKYSQDSILKRLECKLRLHEFYHNIDYPFISPIIRDFNTIFDKRLRTLLKRYNYNLFLDVLFFPSYLFGKLFKII